MKRIMKKLIKKLREIAITILRIISIFISVFLIILGIDYLENIYISFLKPTKIVELFYFDGRQIIIEAKQFKTKNGIFKLNGKYYNFSDFSEIRIKEIE
jgi:hypothetical protein